MKISTRIAKDAEVPSVKKIMISNAWETLSEDQRRKLYKEKWSRRMCELFDMMVTKESVYNE